MREPGAPSSRILSLQLHLGASGTCALDGFGLAPGGWKTSRVAARSREALDRFLRRAVRRFHPVAVVLGVSRRSAPGDTERRRWACTILRELNVPVVVRHVREAYQLFRGRIRGTHREELATTLIEGFLPDLRPSFSVRKVREMRSAWHALAVGLVELVERFPRAAAALATSAAFKIPMLRRALQVAHARRYDTHL